MRDIKKAIVNFLLIGFNRFQKNGIWRRFSQSKAEKFICMSTIEDEFIFGEMKLKCAYFFRNVRAFQLQCFFSEVWKTNKKNFYWKLLGMIHKNFLFIYLFICLFIYLFILYFMLTFTIKSVKHSDLYNSLYTNSYTQMVFNKQICMLIYANQTNRENELLKKRLKY